MKKSNLLLTLNHPTSTETGILCFICIDTALSLLFVGHHRHCYHCLCAYQTLSCLFLLKPPF